MWERSHLREILKNNDDKTNRDGDISSNAYVDDKKGTLWFKKSTPSVS